MALRDKLRERIQPSIPAGEQVQHVFQAQTGPNPKWMLLTFWLVFLNKYFIVAVTDGSIIVHRASMWVPTKPKSDEPPIRLPRAPLGEPKGFLFTKIELGGETYHVHRRFHNDVREANASIGAAPMPPPGPATSPPA